MTFSIYFDLLLGFLNFQFKVINQILWTIYIKIYYNIFKFKLIQKKYDNFYAKIISIMIEIFQEIKNKHPNIYIFIGLCFYMYDNYIITLLGIYYEILKIIEGTKNFFFFCISLDLHNF